MFPLQRPRRLRVNESIRSLVRETTLSPSDFMFPMFITEGENYKVEIPSMPGIFRRSIDLTVEEVKELFALGIRAVNIYVKVDESLKDNTGKEAWNPNGLMQRAIKAIKSACPEMIVMPDVALDPYSIYGHDGIIENGDVANDATNQRIYLFPTGLARVQYGQTTYSTLTAAVAAILTENFTVYPNNANNGILIGVISVRSDATNLSDAAQAIFTPTSKFGELTGGTTGLSTTNLYENYTKFGSVINNFEPFQFWSLAI